MRFWAGIAALVVVFGLVLGPQNAGRAESVQVEAADRAAIVAAIQGQLTAFRAGNGPAAFAHASPTIKQMFGTMENFMAMVQSAYPAVYRARNVEFRDTLTTSGDVVQRVRLVGPDGRAVIAAYQMEKQPDGSWRINGCSLLDDDDKSA